MRISDWSSDVCSSDLFKSGTFLDVPVTTYGVQRDTYDKNQQYTIGAKQFFGESSISSEFTYQKSTNELSYSELDLATVLPRLTIDTNRKVPPALVAGIELTDLKNYKIGHLTPRANHHPGNS